MLSEGKIVQRTIFRSRSIPNTLMTPRERRSYCVYIMGSLSGTPYVGFTGNVHKRVFQHKFHQMGSFTNKYNAERLLYWASYDDVHPRSCAREATERLVPGEENRPYRVTQRAVARLGQGVVSVDEEQ